MNDRKNCPLRHANGNCLPVGGFCTSVNDQICNGLQQAYDHGRANNCDGCPWKSKQWKKMGRAALPKEKQPEASLFDDGEDFADIGDYAVLTRRWKCSACGSLLCLFDKRPKIKYCFVCGTKFKETEDT